MFKKYAAQETKRQINVWLNSIRKVMVFQISLFVLFSLISCSSHNSDEIVQDGTKGNTNHYTAKLQYPYEINLNDDFMMSVQKGKTSQYTAKLQYPYEVIMNVEDNALISQKIQATDLTLVQNIAKDKTISYKLDLPKLKVIANIDENGKVKSMMIDDSDKKYIMEWDAEGHRIKEKVK